ncbi:MAG: polyhydroxyalkanoate synthesis repressor PhaR [Beijerinckiaceae bacterium]|jgi:polyhydroxyalkanoate synthesis repressor PhaR
MTSKKPPIAIKKYANRRLYHTGTSTYVTLDDLAVMVKRGEDFVVSDAKSGDDITRSVLAQIIFEQEGKSGQNLLPVSFLRQLIGFYGDSMQSLVPTYLEHSIKALTENQQKFRDQFATTFPTFGLTETQVAKNMDMFRQSLSLFNAFVPGGAAGIDPATGEQVAPAAAEPEPAEDIDDLKRELSDLQRRLDKFAGK